MLFLRSAFIGDSMTQYPCLVRLSEVFINTDGFTMREAEDLEDAIEKVLNNEVRHPQLLY